MIHSDYAGGIMPPASRLPSARTRRLRRAALLAATSFTWSFVLATPALALAHPAPKDRSGIRLLTPAQMRQIVGRQMMQAHTVSVDAAPGGTYPWEGSAGGANTGNGNKQTSIPLVSWTQKGGLPIALSLTHNSETNRNAELGYKWSHSYDIYLMSSPAASGGTMGGAPMEGFPSEAGTAPNTPPAQTGGGGFTSGSNLVAHWGDDLSYPFANNGSNQFAAPTGLHDTLVKNVDGTFTLTKTNQVKYHFNAALYCDQITDVICPRKFSPVDMLDSSTKHEESDHETGTVYPREDRIYSASGRERRAEHPGDLQRT